MSRFLDVENVFDVLERQGVSPFRDFKTITPDDGTDLEKPGFVATTSAGAIQVTTASGDVRIIPDGWAQNSVFPVMVTRVWATNTVASPIYIFEATE